MLESILQYFNWTALIMSSLLVALTVVVVNQTSKGLQIHNALIALVSAVFLAPLFTDWSQWPAHWQSIIVQLWLTVMAAAFIGFTRYVDITSSFVSSLLDKANIKKGEGQ